MKKYSIRTESGTLIATVTGRHANNILQKAEGFWREYEVDDEYPTRCFELTEDGQFGLSAPLGNLTIHLWKGTLVIER